MKHLIRAMAGVGETILKQFSTSLFHETRLMSAAPPNLPLDPQTRDSLPKSIRAPWRIIFKNSAPHPCVAREQDS